MIEQEQVRVLIAAATPTLRAGLRAMLANEATLVVAEASALRAADVEQGAVDVLVVADEQLVADAAGALAEQGRVALVLLADSAERAATLQTLPLRGWGIVSPDAASAELQAAVLAVAQGLVVLAPALAAQLLRQPTQAAVLAEPLAEPLTAREREVLALLSQGLSNKLIARTLNISEHTVKFHVSSLFAKLNASSRTDAVSRGARQGLITL